MPREYITITLIRRTTAQDDSGGRTTTETTVGAYSQIRSYWTSATKVERDEDGAGVVTKDYTRIVASRDLAFPAQINDIVVFPDGTREKVRHVHKYARHIECEMQSGAV